MMRHSSLFLHDSRHGNDLNTVPQPFCAHNDLGFLNTRDSELLLLKQELKTAPIHLCSIGTPWLAWKRMFKRLAGNKKERSSGFASMYRIEAVTCRAHTYTSIHLPASRLSHPAMDALLSPSPSLSLSYELRTLLPRSELSSLFWKNIKKKSADGPLFYVGIPDSLFCRHCRCRCD